MRFAGPFASACAAIALQYPERRPIGEQCGRLSGPGTPRRRGVCTARVLSDGPEAGCLSSRADGNVLII
jgi:hypothetical protein